MRKIIATEYVTMDGVFEGPGGQEVFKNESWSHPFWSEDVAKFKYEELFSCDAQLLGRVTYEGFAKAWPTMEGTGEFGERMNSMKKYVVSTTLQNATWDNTEIIRENVVEEITKLKQEPGQDILVAGSAELVNFLLQHNLIDELRMMIHPIVVGKGKKLFKDGLDRKQFKLVDTKSYSKGIVVLTYQATN